MAVMEQKLRTLYLMEILLEWTMRKEVHLKKDGAFYEISPWALTWDDENYYLVTYDDKVGIMKHYRVDKMQHIGILDKERLGKEEYHWQL